MVDGGETMGGLKSKPGGTPVSMAPFMELASDPAAMSWDRSRPDEGFVARSKVYTGGVSRRTSSSVRVAAEWFRRGRRARGASLPKSISGMEGAQYALRR